MRKRQRGFTLVELLVVIGVIALLISILLPALNKARTSAQDLKCLSNLKQLGGGVAMYVSEHKGWLPWSSFDGDPANGAGFAYGNKYSMPTLWRWQIGKYVGLSNLPAVNGPLTPFASDWRISEGVFRCPRANVTHYITATSTHYAHSDGGYGWNSTYMGAQLRRYVTAQSVWKETNSAQQPIKILQINNSADRILCGDASDEVNPNSTTAVAGKGINAFSQIYAPSDVEGAGPGQESRLISRRHKGGANMLYADFHAEWRHRDTLYKGRDSVGPDDYFYRRSEQ